MTWTWRNQFSVINHFDELNQINHFFSLKGGAIRILFILLIIFSILKSWNLLIRYFRVEMRICVGIDYSTYCPGRRWFGLFVCGLNTDSNIFLLISRQSVLLTGFLESLTNKVAIIVNMSVARDRLLIPHDLEKKWPLKMFVPLDYPEKKTPQNIFSGVTQFVSNTNNNNSSLNCCY